MELSKITDETMKGARSSNGIVGLELRSSRKILWVSRALVYLVPISIAIHNVLSLSISLSVCLSVCLSLSLSLCLSVCLSLSLSRSRSLSLGFTRLYYQDIFSSSLTFSTAAYIVSTTFTLPLILHFFPFCRLATRLIRIIRKLLTQAK